MKYIRVFYPRGQPLAVQIGARPICASPLKCLEHFRTALTGRAAINIRDEIYKDKVSQRKATRYFIAYLKWQIVCSIPYLIRIPAENTKKTSLIFSLANF